MTSSPLIDARLHLDHIECERIAALVDHSLDVIAVNQAASGAYPASPNFPVYRYCWFRDGAFIADAMSRAGRVESADAFFRWCSDVVVARADQIDALVARKHRGEPIPADELLPCRYTLDGEGVDASLIACATPFRLFAPDDALMAETIRALEAELAHGGVHRYSDDTYFGGGEWLLLAALLGWHYVEVGRIADACAQLSWVAAQARPGGDMPEQVSGHLLAPGSFDEWVERWGPVATPLLWSHAMFVI